MERLKVLNQLDQALGTRTSLSIAPDILGGAYKYVCAPKSVGVGKLPLKYRTEFTELVLFLRKIPFKMSMQDAQKEAEDAVTNPELKKMIKAMVGELYTKTFSKIKLIEPTKLSDKEQAMFYIGNLKQKAPVETLFTNFKSLRSLKWKVKVIISNNTLSRVGKSATR